MVVMTMIIKLLNWGNELFIKPSELKGKWLSTNIIDQNWILFILTLKNVTIYNAEIEIIKFEISKTVVLQNRKLNKEKIN